LADYYPLIDRAIGGLEHNTGENRRLLYERARSALVAQLRGVQPPLDEAEITRERLALEDAIRRIEADQAKARDTQESVEEPPPPRPSLTDQGLKGFRETVAEAEGLGEASSRANKAARELYDEQAPETNEPVPSEAAALRDPEPAAAEAEQLPESWPPSPYTEPAEETYKQRRSWRGLVTALIVLLLLGGVGALAYWQRATLAKIPTQISAMVASLRPSSPPPQAPREATPSQPKITDRVGAPSSSSTRPANAPAADVAQKVVLYEEEQNNPQGRRFVGSAVWRTETVSPGPGLAPELAIRADVEIPERRMRMTWSLRRNSDKTLPASHTIEIMFTLPADFPEGGVQNVPGVLMKQNEQTRGVPLAGLAVKVTNNFFLIGLSSVEIDLQRNIALLKERPWFDVPIVYNSTKRALLAVEKGTPGERAFEEAFRAWGQ
jgi:hypothetical protein